MPLWLTLDDNVLFGQGALSRLDDYLGNYRHILLFVDRDGFPQCGAADYFDSRSADFQVEKLAYSGKALPLEDVEAVYDQVKENGGIDLIIGLGGGTVIDLAKIVSLAYANGCRRVADVLENRALDKKIDLIFVPTTAGTGSEATTFAVVYRDKIKLSVVSPGFLPRLTVLDPLLLRSLPGPVLNSTILDALAQGVESIWARGATLESRQFAGQSVSLIYENVFLENFLDRLGNLQLGSFFSGKAIDISKTTLSHSISYPLTAHFGIPHGLAVFLTLPAVTRFNYFAPPDDLAPGLSPAHIQESFSLLFRLFSVTDIDSLVGRLEEVLARLHFQPRLRAYGIQSGDLHRLADQALTKGRSDNNPRRVDSAAILDILQQVY